MNAIPTEKIIESLRYEIVEVNYSSQMCGLNLFIQPV